MLNKIIFIANNNIGNGISGGDRIFVELIRYWKEQMDVVLFGSEETKNIIKTYNITGIQFICIDKKNPAGDNFSVIGLLFHQIKRTFKGIQLLHQNAKLLNETQYIYSVSDFFPDVLPALYAKLRNRKLKWIAAFYLFAAKPFSKESPYKGFFAQIRGALYYFGQQISYFFIKRYASFVVLCNELDRKIFINDGFPASHMLAIYGGVDLKIPNSIPEQSIKYDAVYMARFHPQKGPMIAVEVWKEVVKIKPNAKLIMIGNGPLEEQVNQFIKNNHLEQNINLIGFADGIEKYKILKSAKIFIHSAIYETGGMAAAEGMAAVLPVVAFDHEGFNYCYPKGIIRVAPIGNAKKMAETILELLNNQQKYNAIKQEAMHFVQEWDWPKRAAMLWSAIEENTDTEKSSLTSN